MYKKCERISDAAKLFLQIGEFKLYCECLISNNDWDRALAFAPSVSYQYWENVSNRYADFLKT